MRPKARTEALIIETLPDETLVYDERTDRAHCLNATAAFVWSKCDGKTDVSQLARMLHSELGSPENEQIIVLALERLGRAKLLVESPAGATRGFNRRDFTRRLARAGAAAILIPSVITIISPTASAAASCGVCTPCGGAGGGQPDCCPGYNCNGAPGICDPIGNESC